MTTPPARTYWVLPEKLLAGPYPGSPWAGQKAPLLTALLELGFSFFLDLTEPHENDTHPYEEELARQSAGAEPATVHHRVAVPDYGTPSVAQMHEILRVIDIALDDGHRVYLHCYAGVGRSAAAAGCYLVHWGFDSSTALKVLNPEGRSILVPRLRRPGTPEQRRMVEAWAEIARGQER